MAIDPATIATVVEIGIKLYNFVDKAANKGEKGDALQPVITELHAIRQDINSLGEKLRLAIDGAVDTIVSDIRLTQLAQLPDAHAAVVDYLRTYPNPPTPPERNDPNYVVARGKTLDVVMYFLNHNELAFMGGFVYAMNARVEFMTSLDPCWFKNDPSYLNELRNAVNHLNGYISYIKAGINQQFRVNEHENFHFEQPDEPPFGHPIKVIDSITFSVTGFGQTFFAKTVPVSERATTRTTANNIRKQASLAKQNEIMTSYDQIAMTWNRLAANVASAAIQRALLPRAETSLVRINTSAPDVTSLQPIEPARELRAGNGEQDLEDPRYELPLRDMLLQILQSPEFQQRQQHALRGDDRRVSSFWVEKAFHREPTAEEASTLANVLKQFGYKAFFSTLAYSREYEERWGTSVPTPMLGEVVEA
jgi:hypothetical protein